MAIAWPGLPFFLLAFPWRLWRTEAGGGDNREDRGPTQKQWDLQEEARLPYQVLGLPQDRAEQASRVQSERPQGVGAGAVAG